jgi:hypothetical protein
VKEAELPSTETDRGAIHKPLKKAMRLNPPKASLKLQPNSQLKKLVE